MSEPDEQVLHRVAEAVRERCIEEARDAFEQGGRRGLCVEGRWDLTLDRLRSLELDSLVHTVLRAGAHEKP